MKAMLRKTQFANRKTRSIMTRYFMALRFLLVGGSTALLQFGLTFILVEGLALHATIASTIAYTLSVCYNYLLHYHWTFSTNAPHRFVATKYLLTCFGGILLNALVMHFGVMLLAVHYLVVQLFATALMVCWSLSISALWVFK